MTAHRGFGSVRELPSKRYQASYWHEGVRHKAPRTFRTQTDTRDWLTSEKAKLLRGDWSDPGAGSLRFDALSLQWTESNPAKRESTRSRDEISLRVHILPSLGGRRIAMVTPVDIQNLVNEWSTNQAPRTVRRNYDVLRAVFGYAVRIDYLARTPCRNIRLPEASTPQRVVPSPSEVSRIAESMPEPYRLTVWLGAVLGLRWGEVAGLRVKNVDVLGKTLSVVEQLTRGKGGRSIVGRPKSLAGIRTISIPAALADLVAEHMSQAGLTAVDRDSYLFVSDSGTPLDYSNFRRRIWLPAIASAGMSGVGFHDLRRAAATALVGERIDIKTAQTRLGHADPRLTLALYAQATTENDVAAATRLGAKFLGSSLTESTRRPAAS